MNNKHKTTKKTFLSLVMSCCFLMLLNCSSNSGSDSSFDVDPDANADADASVNAEALKDLKQSVWHDDDGDGAYDFLYTKTYDSQGNLVQKLTTSSDGTTSSKDTYEYNSNNLLTTASTDDDNDGTVDAQQELEYNDQGHPIKYTYQSKTTYQTDFSYNSDGLVSQVIVYINGDKVGSYTYSYGYNDAFSMYSLFVKRYSESDELLELKSEFYDHSDYYKNCYMFVNVDDDKCDVRWQFSLGTSDMYVGKMLLDEQRNVTEKHWYYSDPSVALSDMSESDFLSLFSDYESFTSPRVEIITYEYDEQKMPIKKSTDYKQYSNPNLNTMVSEEGSSEESDGSILEERKENYWYRMVYKDGSISSVTDVDGDGVPDEVITAATDLDDGAGESSSGASDDAEIGSGEAADEEAIGEPVEDEETGDEETSDEEVGEEGGVDDSEWPTYYQDLDGDGFGSTAKEQKASSKPEGFVDNDTDCNDKDSSINPDALEYCNDTLDSDCDGATDERFVDGECSFKGATF